MINTLLSGAGTFVGVKAGDIFKKPLDKIFNPTYKQYERVSIGITPIMKTAPESMIPPLMGNMGDSTFSELFNAGATSVVKPEEGKSDKK